MTANHNNISAGASDVIDEATVKAYLQENPTFFENHPELLELIQLPHESGASISLIERQIAVLRERNMEMRKRLSKLLEATSTNDKLFEKTKRLVLNLLSASDLKSLVDTLYESLGNDYQLQYFSLVLLTDATHIADTQARVVSLDKAESHIGTLLHSNRPICGILRQQELLFLFGDKAASEIGSVAAVPLTRGQSYGILSIGNSDPNYYRSSMGTLFLNYITEVLNRILPKFIK